MAEWCEVLSGIFTNLWLRSRRHRHWQDRRTSLPFCRRPFLSPFERGAEFRHRDVLAGRLTLTSQVTLEGSDRTFFVASFAKPTPNSCKQGKRHYTSLTYRVFRP